MKTKPTYSDAVHWLGLWLHCLRFREKYIIGVKEKLFCFMWSFTVFYQDAKKIKISSVLCPYELLDLISSLLWENRTIIFVVSGLLTQSQLAPSKWASNQKSKTQSISCSLVWLGVNQLRLWGWKTGKHLCSYTSQIRLLQWI